jgi:hypothetical protein
MTLKEALAVYLYYFQASETLERRDEQILDAAWKIIDQQARKAIEAHDHPQTALCSRHVAAVNVD